MLDKKICTRCNLEKPLNKFRNRQLATMISKFSRCKECEREVGRAVMAARSPERKRKYKRELYQRKLGTEAWVLQLLKQRRSASKKWLSNDDLKKLAKKNT